MKITVQAKTFHNGACVHDETKVFESRELLDKAVKETSEQWAKTYSDRIFTAIDDENLAIGVEYFAVYDFDKSLENYETWKIIETKES